MRLSKGDVRTDTCRLYATVLNIAPESVPPSSKHEHGVVMLPLQLKVACHTFEYGGGKCHAPEALREQEALVKPCQV